MAREVLRGHEGGARLAAAELVGSGMERGCALDALGAAIEAESIEDLSAAMASGWIAPKDVECGRALARAAMRNSKACFEALLRWGAPLDIRYGAENAAGYSAYFGRSDLLRLLIESGCELEARGSLSRTPLIQASGRGCQVCLEMLLDAGCDIEAMDERGYTAAKVAAVAGWVEGLRELVERGCDIDKGGMPENGIGLAMGPAKREDWILLESSTTTAAMWACCARGRGSLGCLELLDEAGADLGARDAMGATAAHYAARVGSAECLAHLAGKGISMGERDLAGATAAMLASGAILQQGQEEKSVASLAILIASGVDLAAKDSAGMTAFHRAACAGNTGCGKMLMERGVDVLDKDVHGKTAMDIAREKEHEGFVAMLEAMALRKELSSQVDGAARADAGAARRSL